MRIRITRATVCGGIARDVGEVVDASDRDARVLLAMGKAAPADQDAAEGAPVDQDDAQDAPKRRGRPPKAAQ